MRQKLNETYINSLVEKIINETIHEKAEQIENMLMGKETEEGNAFTAALAKTKKGEKFKVGDNTFTDTSDYNEGELGEGESVCEQCGAKGPIMEGNMCEQCSMKEGVYEEEDMDVMDMEELKSVWDNPKATVLEKPCTPLTNIFNVPEERAIAT